MSPEEAARLLREELSDSFAEIGAEAAGLRLHSIQPPAALHAESVFLIAVHSPDRGTVELELPANLAVGYLADEEAAVDEWKRWVAELRRRLQTPGR